MPVTDWINALKEWNGNRGTWCIPRKGTAEHAEVKAIMERKKKPYAKAPGVASAIGKLREVEAETRERNLGRKAAAAAKAETPRDRNIRQAMERIEAMNGIGLRAMIDVANNLDNMKRFNSATAAQMRRAYELGAAALRPLPTKKADAFRVTGEHVAAIPSLLIAAGMDTDAAISKARQVTERFITDGDYNLGFRVHKTPTSLVISEVKPR